MKITKTDTKNITEVIEAADFYKPTPDQKRVKAAFWVAWNSGPVRDTDNISANAVVDLTGTRAVIQWWSVPKFKDWFFNSKSFEQTAEYLAHLAQETVAEIMLTAEKPSERLKAAELAIKMAGKEKRVDQEVRFKELPTDLKKLQQLVDATAKRVVEDSREVD